MTGSDGCELITTILVIDQCKPCRAGDWFEEGGGGGRIQDDT